MKEAELTIVIPFLNEKEEVRNTIQSIRDNSNSSDILIMLINDASDDGFDYKSIAKEYNTIYIHNKTRLGVAASRDLGVVKSNTPYILFLDAHMRFYDNQWVIRILEELKKDSKVLLCCQTKGLTHEGGKVVEIKKRPLSYGAYVEFYDEKTFLECFWIFNEDKKSKNCKTVDVPCIYGAAYAFNREYWIYLKGLTGLRSYGSDEPYISMKVWLEGGSCKLLKDVYIAHLYRNAPPYSIENKDMLFNRLLIATLLLPSIDKARIFSLSQSFKDYNKSIMMIYSKREEIYAIKRYYNRILQRKFNYFKRTNGTHGSLTKRSLYKKNLLYNISQHLILHSYLLNNSLIEGRLGVVIFLYHYSLYAKNHFIKDIAETILADIFSTITYNNNKENIIEIFETGWCISYLHQNNFIKGDINNILEEFDDIALDCDINKCNSLNKLLHYILSRLYSIEKNGIQNPFSQDFLKRIYTRCNNELDNHTYNLENIDIIIRFCIYYEKLSEIQTPTIYDLVNIHIPEEYQYKKISLGLNGNAGVGIKLILEE